MAEQEMEPKGEGVAYTGGAGQSDGAQPIGGMIGARNLLIIIVTMPLVFLGVVAAIIMTFGSPLSKKDSVRTSHSTVRSTPAAPSGADNTMSGQRAMLAIPASSADGAIALPEGAAPGAISLDGDRLAVRVDDPDGAVIVIYDLAQRRVIQSVPIVKTAQAEHIRPNVKTATVSPPAKEQNIQTPPAKPALARSQTAQTGLTGRNRPPGREQPGLTLAAPGDEPAAGPAEISLAAAVLDDEPAGAPAAVNTKTVPTPSLGARRTKYITTPQ